MFKYITILVKFHIIESYISSEVYEILYFRIDNPPLDSNISLVKANSYGHMKYVQIYYYMRNVGLVTSTARYIM